MIYFAFKKSPLFFFYEGNKDIGTKVGNKDIGTKVGKKSELGRFLRASEGRKHSVKRPE